MDQLKDYVRDLADVPLETLKRIERQGQEVLSVTRELMSFEFLTSAGVRGERQNHLRDGFDGRVWADKVVLYRKPIGCHQLVIPSTDQTGFHNRRVSW
jgi:hypothetical protein